MKFERKLERIYHRMFLLQMVYKDRLSKCNYKNISQKSLLTWSFAFSFNKFTANMFNNHFTKWYVYLVKNIQFLSHSITWNWIKVKPSRHLLVQSQQVKYHNNAWNLFKVNNKDTISTAGHSDIFIVNCEKNSNYIGVPIDNFWIREELVFWSDKN